MPKHLQTLVKECRYLLEKDFADQATANSSAKDLALVFFLELAAIRCFEEQVWQVPTHLVDPPAHTVTLEQIEIARKLFYSELSFLSLKKISPAIFPSGETLRAILHHLVVTITREEWRSEHILGWLYQYFDEDTSAQKQQGKFYTPESIAEYIVTQALDMLQRSTSEISPSSLSILDLACGSGAFALRAFEHLHTYYKHHQTHRSDNVVQQIVERNLFLIDHDPWACHIAAINLYLKAKRLEPSCQIRRMNIVAADALRIWEHEQDTKLQKFFTQKYQLVIGNPPYIVINQLRTSKDRIRLYKSYQSAAFKINTFALFIERGLDLLAPGGILGMIVPNTFLTQVYFKALRKYILAASAIRRILDTKRMFENAFVENCIVLLQREHNATNRYRNVIECHVKDIETSSFQKRHSVADSVEGLVCIPQRHFEKAPFNMFNVHINEPIFALLEKIANGNPKLGEVCESHDGVNPGNAKQKLIVAGKLDDNCKKVLNGKNIGRYWLKWGGLYVRYNRRVLTKGDNVRWGHRPSLDSPKILTRQTADRIIATFDDGQYYTTNSIHTTVLQDGNQNFSLKYILALLNSKLISFYYRKLISEAGQVFCQVKLINLRQLPVKNSSLTIQQQFIENVERLLHTIKNHLSVGLWEERDFMNHPERYLWAECSQQERRWLKIREQDELFDQAVYELYELTPQEIQLVEGDMGVSVCLYPRSSVDELKKYLSCKIFPQDTSSDSQLFLQLSQKHRVHPESLLDLKDYYFS